MEDATLRAMYDDRGAEISRLTERLDERNRRIEELEAKLPPKDQALGMAQYVADEYLEGKRVRSVERTDSALEVRITYEDGTTNYVNGLLAHRIIGELRQYDLLPKLDDKNSA